MLERSGRYRIPDRWPSSRPIWEWFFSWLVHWPSHLLKVNYQRVNFKLTHYRFSPLIPLHGPNRPPKSIPAHDMLLAVLEFNECAVHRAASDDAAELALSIQDGHARYSKSRTPGVAVD